MRIFASERVSGLMQKLGMQEGEAIEHPWVNKAIENAQRKVEGRNFDIRKQLLEYDDVANDQRQIIYAQRNDLLGEAMVRACRAGGVRDGARLCGGLGPCGRCLCCTTFMDRFHSVTVRMAKRQNLSLNPAKISGLCGRLMCCLSHEVELYPSNSRGGR